MRHQKSEWSSGIRPYSALLATWFLTVFVVLAPPVPAHAQAAINKILEGAGEPAATEKLPEAKALEDLAATLKDEKARAALVKQLEALALAQKKAEGANGGVEADGVGARLLESLSQDVASVRQKSGELVDFVLQIPEALENALEGLKNPQALERWGDFLLLFASLVFLCFAAEWAVGFALRGPVERLENVKPKSISGTVLLFGSRLLLRLVPVAAFLAVVYGIIPWVNVGSELQLILLTFVNAHALVRSIMVFMTTVLEPGRAEARLIPRLSAQKAAYWHVWARRLVTVALYGYFAIEMFSVLGGPPALFDALRKLLGLMFTGLLIVVITQNRSDVAALLQGDTGDRHRTGRLRLSETRRWLAKFWHMVAIGYTVLAFLLWAFEVRNGFGFLADATIGSVVVLTLAKLAHVAIRRFLDRTLAVPDDLKARYPTIEVKLNRFFPQLRNVLQWGVKIVAAVMLLDAWGIDIGGWLGSDIGQEVTAKIVAVAGVLLVGWLVWEIASGFIEVKLAAMEKNDSNLAMRWRTVLPLVRICFKIFLVALVGLIALSEIGFEIAPLFATAGVVGLAIGFGAQTLVKDLINGLFILIEDIVAVGDWIDIGGRKGKVESMSIRTLTLRDVEGLIHVIPFSEISSLKKVGRDYAFAVIDAGVAYRENVEEVVAVLRQVGSAMEEDETWGPQLMAPLEVMGVHMLADSAVNIRVRFKTRPQKQFGVRREFQQRMKAAFDAEGIEIPFPHQTLYFGSDKDGSAPPARIATEPFELDQSANRAAGGAG